MQPIAIYSYPSFTPWNYTTVDWLKESGEIKRSYYIEDKKSGDLFQSDSISLVRAKCIGGAAVFPLYATVYLTLHVARAVFRLIGEIGSRVGAVIHAARSWAPARMSAEVFKGVAVVIWQVANEVAVAVACCFFLLGSETGFIVGTFSPYKGRKIEAYCEKKLQRNLVYQLDIRRKGLLKGLKEAENTAFYFAYCFQPKINKTEVLDKLAIRE